MTQSKFQDGKQEITCGSWTCKPNSPGHIATT